MNAYQPINPPAAPSVLPLEVLNMQLERMRAMLYKYSELFYKLIVLGVIVIILMAAASMTDTFRAIALIIPFFTIYLGVQSAYFLSYVVFARVYATGIEKRINRIAGDEMLIAHRLEAAFLYPLNGAQFAGVPARLGQSFIGFITIHFWLTGAVVIALASYRAWQLLHALTLEFPPLRFYFPALIMWSLLHLIYLAWYFGARRDERAIETIVREAYITSYDQA
ncbi:MAG: hypothetical protein H0V88_01515 [Pyrinomonadaceae bacterium]|nr:hypothetical protein [Pyrinomonadaceae bacterium]